MNLNECTGQEVRDILRVLAGVACRGEYRRRWPDAPDHEVWAWSASRWQHYQEQAVELLAVMLAEEKGGPSLAPSPATP